MEPEIRYCSSDDGTRIAYTVYGRGEPALVFISGWGITFQLEAQFDEGIAFYRRLSEKRMVVRYDPRGIGASSHAEDYSADAHCSDAEAVISALELEKYDLFGTASGSPIALLHAHRYPESVRRIVLWEGWSAGNWEPKESVRAVVDLVKANWPLATRMMTDLMGVQGEDMRRRWARLLTTSIEPNAAVAYFESRFEIDVTDVVGDIAQPALLLHRRGNIRMPIKIARELASNLPNARFVELPGKAEPWILNHEDYLSKVEEFLDEDTPSEANLDLPSGTAIILFADIADSTALTERLGDSAFREQARELDASLRGIIREQSGTPIEGKLLGDGVLAVFTSARQAIEAALRCGPAGEGCGLRLHLGVHAGDVISEEGNVYGGAVNIAARIADASQPGEVLVSDTLRGLARTSAGVSFEDRGERELKGVGEPVRVWAVSAKEESTT